MLFALNDTEVHLIERHDISTEQLAKLREQMSANGRNYEEVIKESHRLLHSLHSDTATHTHDDTNDEGQEHDDEG